jgi:hypothetical protein
MVKTSKPKSKWGVFGGQKKRSAEKKWELKPIPEKKVKKPQKMMDQYFPIVKAKPPPPEVNFQGFPIAACRFAPEIGTFVYCPPAYGNTVGGRCIKRERRVCPDCYLSPCMVEERNDEIFEICMNIPTGNWHSQKERDVGFECALDQVKAMLIEIFGGKYVDSIGIPDCVNKMVTEEYNLGLELAKDPSSSICVYNSETMKELRRDPMFLPTLDNY